MTGRADVQSLLEELSRMKIQSLMVEGGASVISSFLKAGVVDSLIITVCPTMVGNNGIGYEIESKVRRIPPVSYFGLLIWYQKGHGLRASLFYWRWKRYRHFLGVEGSAVDTRFSAIEDIWALSTCLLSH